MMSSHSRSTRTECRQRIARQRATTQRSRLRFRRNGRSRRPSMRVPLRAAAVPRKQKTVVVTFGGGARDEETFFPRQFIPIP